MRTIRTGTNACAVAMAAVLSLAPRCAQTTLTALSKEAGTLSDKFAGLARVMAGKYNWKPGEGVRSVGDVFNLIVTENVLLVETLTSAGGGRGGGRGAQVIEPEKTAGSAEDLLRKSAKSHRGTLGRRHEGAGQTVRQGYDQGRCRPLPFRGPATSTSASRIAYARSNGVVPPMVEVRRDSDILGKRAGDHSNTAVRFPLLAVF